MMMNNILIIDDFNHDKSNILKSLKEINCTWTVKNVYDIAENPDFIKPFQVILHFINSTDFSAKFIQIIKYEFDYFIPVIAIDFNNIFSNEHYSDLPYDDIYTGDFISEKFKLRISSYLKLKSYHDRLYNEKNILESKVSFSLEILKNISIGILLFDNKGKIIFENDCSVRLIESALDENVNHLFKSERFLIGKSAQFDFLDELFKETLYLTTTSGKEVEVKRMITEKQSDLYMGALIIKEINTNNKLIKANHKSLKSFLKEF